MAEHRIDAPANWRDMTDTELAWAAIEGPYGYLSGADDIASFGTRLAELSSGQQAVIVTWFCDAEICNGGFHQLFHNSTGKYAANGPEAFRLIGLPTAADATQQAMWFVSEGDFPIDRQRRLQLLPDRKAHARQWSTLDKAYYDAIPESVNKQQAEYIRANPDEFFV
ncbi:MAG: DUF4375 domain-containing protein [Planctomycetota bacterium]